MKSIVDEYKSRIYAIYSDMVAKKNELKEYCDSLIDGSGLVNISEISDNSKKIILNIYTYMEQLNLILKELNNKIYEMGKIECHECYIENLTSELNNILKDLNNRLSHFLNEVTSLRKNLFQEFGFTIK